MASKIKVDQIQTGDGTGTIALQNQLSGMTTASLPALGAAQMPSGSVLQVKSDDWSSESSTTSNTYNDTGLSVSITPSSSSNKILVIATLCSWAMSNSASYWQAQLQRGNTTIQEFQKVGGYSTSGNHATSDSTATIFLDSPNTTSATTYKIQSRPVDSGHLLVMNWNGAISTIIAMEIAG